MSRWGDRYFERQVAAECGQHAVNNVLGGPQYQREAFAAAARQVVAQYGEPEAEHIRPGGWYSHSVLATVLQNTAPAPWKLLFSKLRQTDYHTVLADELICGALVNQDNYHWIALVKHEGVLWEVDSRLFPTPLGREAFRDLLRRYPNTFPVQRCS